MLPLPVSLYLYSRFRLGLIKMAMLRDPFFLCKIIHSDRARAALQKPNDDPLNPREILPPLHPINNAPGWTVFQNLLDPSGLVVAYLQNHLGDVGRERGVHEACSEEIGDLEVEVEAFAFGRSVR